MLDKKCFAQPERVCAAPQQRQKAFTGYKDYLGKDITSLVILPVWIMQPFTMLQNMAEILENSQLLDKAAVCEDPYERCDWLHTLLRAISALSHLRP